MILSTARKNASSKPGARTGGSQQAKKLQRARGIVQQELDHDQIKEDANAAADSIIRLAVLALGIGDGNFRDARSRGARESRNEAVKFAVQLNFLKDFATIGFESGAESREARSR